VRRKEDNVRARDLYLQAVDLDPTFARAYAGLALIHAADYRNQWSDDGEASLNDAVRFAGTALEIDPLLPEAHWAMAYVRVQQREHAAALSELDEALRLQNGFADALALKGGIKTYVGEPRATLDLLRRAIRINPEAGYLYFMTLGRAYYYLGDSVQAVINLREAAARNPSVLEVRAYLAAALLDKGDRADAEWEVAEILAIRPDFSARAWLRTYPMTDTRQQMQLTAALGELGL
jgi:tetratricopeptide (TPR) repeat protein